MAYIISLSNGKGGVAKTTTSIALGGSLSKLGYRVLLIDLDPNANLTLGFGSLPEKPVEYSQDLFILSRSRPIQPAKTGYTNLDLLPSNGYMSLLDKGSSASDLSMGTLRRSLDMLSPGSYDFILIDCPATMGFITINALTAADLLIIPTQSEFFSAYALQTMFSVVVGIRKKYNPELKYRVLVTQFDLHHRDHNNILNQLQKHLGKSLYKTKIFADPLLRESQIQGIPIPFSMPNSTCALQYRKLAQEIVNDTIAERQDRIGISTLESNLQKVAPVQHRQAFSSPANSRSGTRINEPVYNKSASGHLHSLETADNPAARIQDRTNSYCPHLGGKDDPETLLAYPSSWNKCHLSKHILSPNRDHQKRYCISKNYAACPLLKNRQKVRTP
jgi:chromosome partitioning protein